MFKLQENFQRILGPSWMGIIGILLLCGMSRLPQLASPYLNLDSDECVIGLMAKHMASGQEFPFYFWGQGYGFSWIEAGAAAVSFKIFGMSLLSLKIPILILWSLGCVFFYAALAYWTSRNYSFLITNLLIFSPTWMDWSLKARGGYVTSFLLSTIVLFLLARFWESFNQQIVFIVGVLLGFIYFSQPVFLVGLFPLIVRVIFKKNVLKSIMTLTIGFITVFMIGKVMLHVQSNTSFWNPVWYRPDFALGHFKEKLFNIFNQDSGNYWSAVILSNFWLILIPCNLLIYFCSVIFKKSITLSTLLLLSVLCILGCVFIIGTEYRYLLSLSVFLILWFGVVTFEWVYQNNYLKIVLGLVVAFFLILGAFLAWHYKDAYRSTPGTGYEVPQTQKITELINFLEDSKVKYVFSIDDSLGWEILFYSGERITSRWTSLATRYPAYSALVDDAYLKGEPVAVVGDLGYVTEKFACAMVTQEGDTVVIGDRYFAHLKPSKDLLNHKLGFQF